MTVHVSFSGGLDSTALLTRAVRCHGAEDVQAVSIQYGQRHRNELDAAERIAATLGVPWGTLDLTGLLSGSALLSDEPVPEGHYAAPNMAATVVHGRNLLFAAALISRARPGDAVWLGVHAGDHPVYPDCRPAFIDALAMTASTYDVTVRAPWVRISKADIIAAEPDAPYDLTWSCYKGGEIHCGKCGTCVERAEAFSLAGVPDPTRYEFPEFWLVNVPSS